MNIINKFINNSLFQSKISIKLLALTLFFSALITLVITVVQLYIDYKHGYNAIDKQLSLVQSSYTQSLNQSIWVYDEKQIELQLDSMLNMPDIEYVVVQLSSGEIIERGELRSDNYLDKQINLYYTYNTKDIELGKITVFADLSELYDQIIDKIALILFSQGIKTFLTSFFILFIFERLVTKHIQKIVEYTNSISMDIPNEPLELDKSIFPKKHDELDDLTSTINVAYKKVYQSFQDVMRELDKRIKAEKSLERHYLIDSLTELGNRTKLIKDIELSSDPAIAVIDIDDFKEINDFYGNTIGDRVIFEFSKKLSKAVASTEYEIYRLQADQFACLCKECKSQKEFQNKIKDLVKESLSKSIHINQYEILLMATVGIDMGKENMLINADIALKMAKKERKNFGVYSKNLNVEKKYEHNLEWTKKLKKALEEDRIIAFFQPLYCHSSKKIKKFESLVRMVDEDGKIISPFFFLDIAFKTKLYPEITIIMINKTIEAAKKYDYSFSINFTIDDLLDHETMVYFMQEIENHNIGKKIVVEIVESEGIENFKFVQMVIDELKDLGCRLAIDDFGTGYSNFEYLLKLNADYVKIDGSLIKNIHEDSDMLLVTKNIVSFSKITNMKTIAEFVCNEKINDIVKDIGIDYSQGYYISEPVSFDEIAKF